MEWFFIALFAPFFFAITCFIEKIMVERFTDEQGSGVLIVFSGLIGFLIALIIFLFKSTNLYLPLMSVILLFFAGLLYTFSLIPYFSSLENNDTSLVASLFQLIPLFSLFLGMIFLKEFLSFGKIIGGVIIILGAIILSLDFNLKGIHFNKKLLFLMFLSCFGFASYSLLFKVGSLNFDYWVSSFWFYIGVGFSGIISLIYRPYRVQFLHLFKSNFRAVFGLNVINETLGFFGTIILNFAFLLAPLALVWIVNGLQPVFIFIIGLFLTLFVPQLIKEKISKKDLIHKIIAISFLCFGAVLLNL